MRCPYCKVEYTWDDPCFCQPRVRGVKQPAETLTALASEERKIPALAPTGLDNPFWKP